MISRIDRIEYLRGAVADAKSIDPVQRKTYLVRGWQGGELNLPVIRADVDYLMFRLQNARTFREQRLYLRNQSSLRRDIFNDPERPDAQSAQELILLEMVSSDFLKDLEHGQEEPAIITFDGYLVNGNRRMAALKHLGKRRLECVVLPENATDKDIYELEQLLQVSKDFKVPYHWIDELHHIRIGKTVYHFTDDELARNLRLNDKRHVTSKLKMLDLVDLFLIWRQIPGEYEYQKLTDAEQTFIELEKAEAKYKGDQQKSLQHAVFHLIESKPEERSLYYHVSRLIRNFDRVYQLLPEKVSFDNQFVLSSSIEVLPSPQSLLDEILENEPVANVGLPYDASKIKAISEMLVDTTADIVAIEDERKGAEVAYKYVSSALRDLHVVVIDDQTMKLTDIKNKLEQIIVEVQRLLIDAERYLVERPPL